MSNMQDAINMVTREVAKKAVAIEDSAVAQYIKSQAEYLVSKGEDLTQYELVRGVGDYEIGDDRVTGKVKYGLVKSEDIKEVPHDN